ncbi:MAG TPA: glycosyltransferase family 2 protein [Phycisphaerales bacterium]|nr:glycosyltransferase family 2 protein [Phycisphaerales bacterium]
MSPNFPLISIIAPAHNEQENIPSLVSEVERAGRELAAKLGAAPSDPSSGFEFILVDDGSTDNTRAVALDFKRTRPWLRIVAMQRTPPGKGNGQSAAFHAGFRAARAPLIAVLDADLQNDPGDLLAMFDLMQRDSADMVQGDRSAARRDGFIRRAGSRVGRFFRALILGDSIRDTGCSLRLMNREIALRLPLEFKGAHRFIPVSARHMGYKVVEMPVHHRPRTAGQTKYGLGIVQRAIPGLIDCFAIRWMKNRRRPVEHQEIEP